MVRALTAAKTCSIESIVNDAVHGVVALISKVRGREIVYDVLAVSDSVRRNVQRYLTSFDGMIRTRRRR